MSCGEQNPQASSGAPTAEPGRATARALLPLLLTVAALVCFFRLGSETLYETDEGFAGTRADSFFRHRSWVLSYDDVGETEPQFRKPPLLYWCVALLLKVLGHNTWAVRLPTALAGFLSVALLYKLVRRYADEWTACAAGLLLCAVPFAILHIRTAMLELPVAALLLAGMYSFAFLPPSPWRPVLTGLCGGAAVLIKGSGGLQALVVPLLFGLAHHRWRRRAWLESLASAAVALALPALYYLAVPAAYRERVIRDLFVGEGAKRVKLAQKAWARLAVGYEALQTLLRWHLPAAGCGLLLMAGRAFRRPRLAEWVGIAVVFLGPLLWVYAAMVPPFPRYLLPAFPLLLSFSAYFALETVSSRLSAAWLIPFAWWATNLDHRDPWQWTPTAAAAVALLGVWSGWTAAAPRRRRWLGLLLLAAIATASYNSPRAWSAHPPPAHRPQPDLVPLVRQAAAWVPEDGRLIMESRLKCHTALFYGRRAIEGHLDWLLSSVAPGETRYGIFRSDRYAALPFVRAELLAVSGAWKLVRLTAQAAPPWHGVVLVKPEERDRTARALALLDVEAEPIAEGYVIRRVPDRTGEPAAAARAWIVDAAGTRVPWERPAAARLAPGSALVLQYDAPFLCAGVDLAPADRRDELTGWVVRGDDGSGAALTLKTAAAEFTAFYTVAAGRVAKARRPAARFRFAPARVTELRIERTGATPIALADVTVWRAR